MFQNLTVTDLTDLGAEVLGLRTDVVVRTFSLGVMRDVVAAPVAAVRGRELYDDFPAKVAALVERFLRSDLFSPATRRAAFLAADALAERNGWRWTVDWSEGEEARRLREVLDEANAGTISASQLAEWFRFRLALPPQQQQLDDAFDRLVGDDGRQLPCVYVASPLSNSDGGAYNLVTAVKDAVVDAGDRSSVDGFRLRVRAPADLAVHRDQVSKDRPVEVARRNFELVCDDAAGLIVLQSTPFGGSGSLVEWATSASIPVLYLYDHRQRPARIAEGTPGVICLPYWGSEDAAAHVTRWISAQRHLFEQRPSTLEDRAMRFLPLEQALLSAWKAMPVEGRLAACARSRVDPRRVTAIVTGGSLASFSVDEVDRLCAACGVDIGRWLSPSTSRTRLADPQPPRRLTSPERRALREAARIRRWSRETCEELERTVTLQRQRRGPMNSSSAWIELHRQHGFDR